VITPPLPIIDSDTAAFWEGTRRGVLLIQKCERCGGYQFYPRLVCIRCAGAVVWIQADGRGTIYSYTVVHREPHEAFRALVPYVIALVDLIEGPRMMTRLRPVSPGSLRIGRDVRVTFERVTEEITLPLFECV
jgi:uncharacterized OB-fold protein